MPKPIDKNKLKVKHLIHVEGVDYPTKEDLLFEVVDSLQEMDLLDAEFKASDIVKGVKARIDKQQLTPSIMILAEEGYFSHDVKNGVTYFKLIKHPWE